MGAYVPVFIAFAALLVTFALSLSIAPHASAVEKGIVDNRLEYHGNIDLAPVPAYAAEMGSDGLRARWTRVFVYWDQLQPDAPWVTGGNVWDEAYLNELETVVAALHAQGMRVILTGSDPPKWARDTRYKKYWIKNPTTAVVRTGDARVLRAFRDFARFVAGHFAAPAYQVKHFEVWNEPNLRLLPQVVNRKVVGPRVYIQMLSAFWKGARSANPRAVVIAGATSRMGSNGTSTGSTSPQWFARYLKNKRATRWFNAYSHHPYSTRMSKPAPSAKPRRPDISVTLGNLPVLLKLFPKLPFYLTEYCYSTGGSKDAFVLSVSPALQARYLRQAYALCGTRAYRQVKALLWFLVRDWQSDPGDPDSLGVYTGLIDYKDQRKPSWWAFAGGNRLTVSAPATVSRGKPFSVDGTLTTREGVGAGVKVLLQRRGLSASTWTTVDQQTTGDAGVFSFQTRQTAAKRYRVVWNGVCESRQRTVGLGR